MSFLDSIKKLFTSREGEDRASLSKKVQSSPNDPQARQKLGIFLMRQGEVVEGLDQLARSAVLYEKDGFATKAIAVLRQMLKQGHGLSLFRADQLDATRAMLLVIDMQEKLTPLLRLKYHNSLADALADLGQAEVVSRIFSGFQRYLYAEPLAA